MISKCANPACPAHFLYLHEGRVFRILRDADPAREAHTGVDQAAKRHARVEFYWLCDRCSQIMTIRYRKGSGIIVEQSRTALRAAS
jgi:hypothetical protein